MSAIVYLLEHDITAGLAYVFTVINVKDKR
jgi:hypothetical protein